MKKVFIRPFYATVQLVLAGNDTEGLRYGVIETPEKYYLTWKEESDIENPLDRALGQLCRKDRLLEIVELVRGTGAVLPDESLANWLRNHVPYSRNPEVWGCR